MEGRQQKVLLFLTLGSCLFALLSHAEGQIRLAGSTPCSGRVEIYHSGSWGTVCDDNWDFNDAKVVCRQLGCGAAAKASQSAQFGEGTGEIWLDEVACLGTESDLTQCRHNKFGTHNCGHNEDAGVVCSVSLPKPSISINRGEVTWGQDVSITCSVSAEFLDGTFILRKVSSSFTQTKTSSSTSATFKLQKVDFDRDGFYQCQYEKYILSERFSSSLSDSVRIAVTVNFPKPRISMSPTGEVTWGQNVGLTCSISTQILDGTFILIKTSDSFRRTEVSSTNPVFSIREAHFDDEGLYRCRYQKKGPSRDFNSPESDSVRLSVTVRLQTPSISLTSPSGGLVWGPEGAAVTRGYSFEFTCSINTSFSSGRFILTFSGSNLTKPAVNNSSSFRFPVAEYEHQGNYSCLYEVTISTRTFRSSPAPPITVIIKLPVMLLVSLVSAGILLLLLLVVCLMRRRRRLAKKPEPLIQTQMSVRAGNEYMYSDDEEDYVTVDLRDTNENIKGGAAGVDEEGSDDYEEPVSDDDHDYEEAGPNDNYKKPKKACANLDDLKEDYEKEVSDDDHDYEEAGPNDRYTKSKEACASVDSHREDEADDEEETSDEENNYENVSAPSPSVDTAEEEETSDEENDYENVSAPSPSVNNSEEDETSDEDNDYENISAP